MSKLQSLVVRCSLVLWCSAAHLALAQPDADKPLAMTPDAAQLQWAPCPALFPKGCEIAVLHGDPAKPNADVFLRVPADYKIPPHWHSSAERMILVQGELRVHYDGHSANILKPGTYAYGPAKAPHSAACIGSEPCVLFIAFESAVDAHPVESPQH